MNRAIIMLLTFLWSSPAPAIRHTGNSLLEFCAETDVNFQLGNCVGYIQGVLDRGQQPRSVDGDDRRVVRQPSDRAAEYLTVLVADGCVERDGGAHKRQCDGGLRDADRRRSRGVGFCRSRPVAGRKPQEEQGQ